MKIITRIILIVGSFLLLPKFADAQIPPALSNDAWRRDANNTSGGSGNVFGTKSWNSPIYFHTGFATGGTWPGIRMKLNGQFSAGNQYQIGGYSWPLVNTSGYLGLGHNQNGIWSSNDLDGSPSRGPFSLLHLSGRDGGFIQSGGFRPWMKTGITFTDNQDLSYMGLRKVGGTFDKTETTITWADNGDGASGPDELAFRFTAGTGSTIIDGDMNNATDLDGRMIAQFRANGNMGLGQIFEPGNTGQKPESRLHIAKTNGGTPISNPNPNEVWAQITNHVSNHTDRDGLRLGLDRIGGVAAPTNGYLQWQEETPFIIQTDWNDSPGGINSGERLRISSISAPDVPNPAGLPSNTTRVSIPILGNISVDEPRSLLHLGYEIGDASGIRPWMNLGTTTVGWGTLTYLGMKEEGPSPEPVLAWGDFNNTGLPIVYTSDAAGTGNTPEGLEVARFSSDATAYGGNGALGVGDFSAGTPTHKLHVRGNARFENVPDPINPAYILLGKQVGGPADIELQKLALTYDPDDVLLGDGTWGSGGAGTDDQAIEIFDFDCVTNVLTYQLEDGGTATADLSCLVTGGGADDDWYVSGTTDSPTDIAEDIYTNGLVGINTNVTPLAQLEIKGDNTNDPLWVNGAHAKFRILEEGNFGVGGNPVLGGHLMNVRDADLDVPNSSHAVNMNFSNTSGNGLNLVHQSDGVNSNGIFSHVEGNGMVTAVNAEAINSVGTTINRGVYARVRNAAESNIAVTGEIPGGMGVTPSGATIGLNTINAANLGLEHYGVKSLVVSQTNASKQYGVHSSVIVNSTSTPDECYGGYFKAKSGGTNYGVWAEAGTDFGDDWGLFVAGAAYTTEGWFPSDRQLKKEVEELSDASEILNQLAPKSYRFKSEEFPSIHLPKAQQYGLISQELEKVLPDLVRAVHVPEQRDEQGRVISEAIDFKGVNYNALIPILIQGHKEQQAEIDALENTVEQMNSRLEKLEALLTSKETQSHDEVTQQVELNNALSIVLDQNVPNPFAEETTIGYEIPRGFERAQMHFFDQQGKIIKTVDLLESGKGTIRVFGEQLSQGVYTYTLVVDGQIIGSKKMIKANH